MKPIEKVSIGGYAFNLDNEAYQRIDSYLTELKGFYGHREGGEEIMEGLEERIAEQLFSCVAAGSVVSLPVIEGILDRLGQPIVLESEAKEAETETQKTSEPTAKHQEEKTADKNLGGEKKRLYRLRDRRVFGGVCSGLSAYWGIDVVWIRLIWSGLILMVLTNSDFFEFFSGAMIVLYFLMCLIVPVADTPKERREANLAAEAARSDFWPVVGRALSIFFGVAGILVAFAGFAVSLVLLFGWNYLPLEWSTYIAAVIPADLMPLLTNAWSLTLFALVFLLPFLFLMYEGIKLVFNLRSPSFHPGLILMVLWLLVLLVCVARLSAIVLPGFLDLPDVFEHACHLTL